MSGTVEEKVFTKTVRSRQGVYYLVVGIAALIFLLLMIYRGAVNITDYFFLFLTFGILAAALIRLVVIHDAVSVSDYGITVGKTRVAWEDVASIYFASGRRAHFAHIEIIYRNQDHGVTVIYPAMLRDGEQLEMLLAGMADQKKIITNVKPPA